MRISTKFVDACEMFSFKMISQVSSSLMEEACKWFWIYTRLNHFIVKSFQHISIVIIPFFEDYDTSVYNSELQSSGGRANQWDMSMIQNVFVAMQNSWFSSQHVVVMLLPKPWFGEQGRCWQNFSTRFDGKTLFDRSTTLRWNVQRSTMNGTPVNTIFHFSIPNWPRGSWKKTKWGIKTWQFSWLNLTCFLNMSWEIVSGVSMSWV